MVLGVDSAVFPYNYGLLVCSGPCLMHAINSKLFILEHCEYGTSDVTRALLSALDQA